MRTKLKRTKEVLLKVKKIILRKIVEDKKYRAIVSRDILEQFFHNEVCLEVITQAEKRRCSFNELCRRKGLNEQEVYKLLTKTGALNHETITNLYDL